jgi:hypothetical protein
MDTDLTAVVVAVVGIAGTLASALLSQRMSMRTKQVELAAQREQRLDELGEKRRQESYIERRDAYVGMNAAARGFRQALKNVLFNPSAEVIAELEEARNVFARRYAEGQLIAPGPVLEAAGSVSAELASCYGAVKRFILIDSSAADFATERQLLRQRLDGPARDVTQRFRQSMRVDLGVADENLTMGPSDRADRDRR